ncbi:immunoglobulin superfamily member 6 [Erpetoichthys calabaricus]|uniref:Ig-like domain-containing protein n=1 Tax=Erpetoichthys calabaricus TaxID=27687 RepID=A0A8C4T6P9_ERPCA|nr:immunoglobulin superfamily member 6 [Erpetoichthys calabaricus]
MACVGLLHQLLLALLPIAAAAAQECSLAVEQEAFIETYERVNTVILPCNFKVSNCHSDPQVLWFYFHENSHGRVKMDSKKHVMSGTGHSYMLTISSVTQNDSGVYYCAVLYPAETTKLSRAVGNGTILAVRETAAFVLPQAKRLLIILTVLLVLYSTGIIVLLVLQKVSLKKARKLPFPQDQNSTKRTKRFQAVLQELYYRRHSGKIKMAEMDDPTSSNDPEIYQNI